MRIGPGTVVIGIDSAHLCAGPGAGIDRSIRDTSDWADSSSKSHLSTSIILDPSLYKCNKFVEVTVEDKAGKEL